MKTLGVIFAILIACAGLLLFLIIRPAPAGAVASLQLPDGSQYLVTQKFNWSLGEPYTVAFYMKSPQGPWGWCYLDHEARGWRTVSIVHDVATDSILISESGVPRARLDRKRNTFAIDNGSVRRELPAPQEVRSPGYAFP